MINIKIQDKKEFRKCFSCNNTTENSNLYEILIGKGISNIQIVLCNDCIKELRRKLVIREVKITPKQRDYINFIEEMTGVQFKEGDNISDYINKNKAEAHRKWLQQCELNTLADGREDAGDRD